VHWRYGARIQYRLIPEIDGGFGAIPRVSTIIFEPGGRAPVNYKIGP
jgi:hypothetical protein